MRPTYYIKTVQGTLSTPTKYKIVANYGTFCSYLLGKSLTWGDLETLIHAGGRLVIDGQEFTARGGRNYKDIQFGENYDRILNQTSSLFLAPGYNATRNHQSITVAGSGALPAQPNYGTRPAAPCATDVSCGPSFTSTTSTVVVRKNPSLWAVIFGE